MLIVLVGTTMSMNCITDTAECQTPQMLKAHINALDVEVMNPDEVANEVCTLLSFMAQHSSAPSGPSFHVTICIVLDASRC